MSERHKLYERAGRVIIDKPTLDALPDWFQQMMARLIVIQTIQQVWMDATEFVALCPQFAPVSPGDFLPQYRPAVEDGRFLRFE